MESADVEPVEVDQASNIDLRRYLAGLRRFIWLIGALVVLAIAGAVMYTNRLEPIYEATSSVQIEPKLPDLLGTGDLFNVAAGASNSTEYYKQQQLVIGSYTLSQQTILANDFIPRLLTKRRTNVRSCPRRISSTSRRGA